MCNLKVTACCGCIPLRIGCIAIAVLMLVAGILLAVFMDAITWVKVLVVIVEVLTWVTLLIGAFISHATVVIISLVGLLLLIIKDAVMMILIIIAFSTVSSGAVGVNGVVVTWSVAVTWFVILMIGYAIGLGLSIYFGIVINSFYRELKFGGQGASYNV